MHRIASILLLTLYLFEIFGYMAPFLAARARIRHEMKQRIKVSVPADELVIITVTAETRSALLWITPSEFRYRGGLYDVVRTERAGDRTRYHCLNDLQEERLFAGLDGMVRRRMEQDAHNALKGTPAPAAAGEHIAAALTGEAPPPLAFRMTLRSPDLPPSPFTDVPVPPPRSV